LEKDGLKSAECIINANVENDAHRTLLNFQEKLRVDAGNFKCGQIKHNHTSRTDFNMSLTREYNDEYKFEIPNADTRKRILDVLFSRIDEILDEGTYHKLFDTATDYKFSDIKWKLARTNAKGEMETIKLPYGSKYSDEVRKLDSNSETIYFYSDNPSMTLYCEVRCFIEENLIIITITGGFMLYLLYKIMGCLYSRKVNA